MVSFSVGMINGLVMAAGPQMPLPSSARTGYSPVRRP